MLKTLGLIASIFLSGCATKHPGTYEVAEASGGTVGSDAAGQAEALWAERLDPAKLQSSLDKYEEMYNADPTNRELAVRLTRGYYLMGDAHKTEMPEKLAEWEKSIAWGKRCIALNGEFTALLEKGDESEETAVVVATADDVPCLYWTATSLGKWAKASGLAKTLKHIGTVKAYIARVEELDATFYFAAADRYWGAYYAAIPSFAGQDLDKSKVHFDKAIAAAPGNLATQVLLAEYWAVKTQNKAVFQETLNKVLASDANAVPALVPENTIEQKKAKNLLASMDDLFAE